MVAHGGKGGHGGDATSVAGAAALSGAVAVNEGNDVAVNVDAGDVEIASGDVTVGGDTYAPSSSYSYHEVKQAPTVIPGSGNNTSSCIKVYGLGGSYADGKAGGFALGFPKRDKDCALDRAARMAFEMGNAHAGWRLYCAQDAVLDGYLISMAFADGTRRAVKRTAAFNACLQETVTVVMDLEASLTDVQATLQEIEATQNVYMDEDLRERVETLESAAHRPRTTTLLVDE
jgi:hypothetical protein